MKIILLAIVYATLALFPGTYANESKATHEPSISYTEVGTGTPLLLIHAFPTDKRLWRQQNDELKNYFRVISLDLKGFGKSQPTDGEPISMEEYAQEVHELLDKLHIEKAIIGGESMGGYVSLAFLKNYPDSVIGLILSDTQTIPDSDKMKIERETQAKEILEHGSEKLIQKFLPKALTENAPKATKNSLEKILKEQSTYGIASALRGMALRKDLSHTLSTTNLPVLIITGKEDKLISPAQSQLMHKLSQKSQLVEIPNAAHLSNLEQPALWNKAVIEKFSK